MKYISIVVLFTSFVCVAETVSTEGKWAHDSEAGLVVAGGNSDSQTYNLKQETSYAWTGNTIKLNGSYLLGKTLGLTTAKKWDLGVRYDREITEVMSGFVGYQIDSSPFSGTYLRHSADIGLKYHFIKAETRALFAEAGYRMTAEQFTLDNGDTKSGDLTSHMSRLYIEWVEKWTEALSSKLWAEYIQSYTNTQDYRLNLEPSISVLLSKTFSLKTAYLLNYRNTPAVAGKKTTDTLLTTSLVAKF